MKQKKPGIFVQSKTNSAKFWPNSAKIFPLTQNFGQTIGNNCALTQKNGQNPSSFGPTQLQTWSNLKSKTNTMMTNVLSHFKQENGLFPFWILSCSFRVPLSANESPHLEQANGFSPVWNFS